MWLCAFALKILRVDIVCLINILVETESTSSPVLKLVSMVTNYVKIQNICWWYLHSGKELL